MKYVLIHLLFILMIRLCLFVFFFCMVCIGFHVFIKTLEAIINAVLFGHQTPLEGGLTGPHFESFSGFSGVVCFVMVTCICNVLTLVLVGFCGVTVCTEASLVCIWSCRVVKPHQWTGS